MQHLIATTVGNARRIPCVNRIIPQSQIHASKYTTRGLLFANYRGISPPIVGRIFRRSSGKCIPMPESRADKWRSTDQITWWAWKRKAAPWMLYAQTAMIRDEGKMHQSPRLEKSKNFLIIVRLSGFILLYFGLHGLTVKCREALKILAFFAFGWHGITGQIVTPKW